MKHHASIVSALICCCLQAAYSAEVVSLPGCAALTNSDDLSVRMVEGIDRFLSGQTSLALEKRNHEWSTNMVSEKSREYAARCREKLREIVGALDRRTSPEALELLETSTSPALLAQAEDYEILKVRWPALEGVHGEGLWLRQKKKVSACVVAIGDAEQTPELLAGVEPGLAPERQFARRLAEHGCEVLVLALVNRDDSFSGNAKLNKWTNQPHREWIYRQAYELGRHIIGYELQKVLAAVDYFQHSRTSGPSEQRPIGVVGYGEGGLLALYAAALDERIGATVVSGYFDSRQNLWQEPIYRNVFGLVRHFGDAEIATLISPRTLIVEHSAIPRVSGPPAARPGRTGAAPGKLETPDYQSVENEYERARALLAGAPKSTDSFTIIAGIEGGTTGPISDRALIAALHSLGIGGARCKPPGPSPVVQAAAQIENAVRQQRQVEELEACSQQAFRESEHVRQQRFWAKLQSKPLMEWETSVEPFRRQFQDEVIGSFGPPSIPANARARVLLDRPKWVAFEVVLDVYPNVFAWGYLLVPKEIPRGEHRPVIVCQHGLEGVPRDVIDEAPGSQAFGYYKAFAAKLADRGLIVFAPHNPYRGGDKFRVLQRKANPLGASLFSVITAQHSRIVEWLSELPFVDPTRIGFYGLSYGGKTAMRVPALVRAYAFSICSGDFNEWVRKNVSTDSPISYMFTGEYEMPEWNLGSTFNYAEMTALIAPRPFMVERGHGDGVGIDEWVAYEYAKVRRLYGQLGVADRTEIEYFNGPHTIHGVGTFDFIQKHASTVIR